VSQDELDELIEKYRLMDEEINRASLLTKDEIAECQELATIGINANMDLATQDDEYEMNLRYATRMKVAKHVADAQLRKAIPIIEAEARKAERERIIKLVLELEERQAYEFPELKGAIVEGGQALRGESDEDSRL